LQISQSRPPQPHPSILIVARSYPPSIGGLQRFSHELIEGLAARSNVRVIVNRHGKRGLPAFLPYAGLKSLFLALTRQVDHVHLCDGALAPLGAVLKAVSGRPVSISVHGLDLTYPNRSYQRLLRTSLARLDLVIAGSEATRAIAVERFPEVEPRTRLINYGVQDRTLTQADTALPDTIEAELRGRRPILTVGRLVRRKGVLWFCQNVLPELPEEVVYVVAGTGPDREEIALAARALGVSHRILLTGPLDDRAIAALYGRAELFVMPNVYVADDIEGFGLVALEAAMSGLPVIASRLQGITDAVHDGSNGFLVEPENADAFVAAIGRVLALTPAERQALGEHGRSYTRSHYSWSTMGTAYLDAFESLRADPSRRPGLPGLSPGSAGLRDE
jgi:phosphatidylinositol alpha-1,6-mannosyltransferase